MLDIEISRGLARTRFQHRISELPDGTLSYRLADKSGHVRVTREEWEATGTFFTESTRGPKRDATIALFLWMPAYVVYIAICGVLLPKSWAQALPEWLSLVIFVGPLFATPFVIFFWWSFRVQRVCKAIDATFAERAGIQPPRKNPFRPPFWLDVLCLLFVGPQLIIAVIGEIDPNALRNTPLTGRHLDWQAMLGFALIAARVAWGKVAKRHVRVTARQQAS